jgi:hypothetical protein
MAQPFKQTPIRSTKLEFSDKASIVVPAEGSKPGDATPAADATIIFHTTGGDQSVKVKIVGWRQLKDKARITILPS